MLRHKKITFSCSFKNTKFYIYLNKSNNFTDNLVVNHIDENRLNNNYKYFLIKLKLLLKNLRK